MTPTTVGTFILPLLLLSQCDAWAPIGRFKMMTTIRFAKFTTVYPADESAIAAFGETPCSKAEWVACYTNSPSVDESASKSLLAQISSELASNSTGPTGIFAVNGGPPAAVGRIHPELGLIDRIISDLPKEKIEEYHESVLSAFDRLLLAWLRHLEESASDNDGCSRQAFNDLRVAASMHVAPMLRSRGFVGVEDLDLAAGISMRKKFLACQEMGESAPVSLPGIPSHRASLMFAIECYKDLLNPTDDFPNAPTRTVSQPFTEARETAEEILRLLQEQPPPSYQESISDDRGDDDGSLTRDPWAGIGNIR